MDLGCKALGGLVNPLRISKQAGLQPLRKVWDQKRNRESTQRRKGRLGGVLGLFGGCLGCFEGLW